MPGKHQVQAAARIIQEVCRPGYRAAMNLADRVLRAVEGKWDSDGPDHDGLTGKPFAGPTPVPCDHERELRRLRHVETDLISLSWQMHDAVGDKGPGPGSPRQYLDMLIAERDALLLDKASRDGLISDLQGEVARLRTQPPAGPAHEVQVLREAVTDSGMKIWIRCSRSDCDYEATIEAPAGQLAHQIVETIATVHYEDMVEEGPDAEG